MPARFPSVCKNKQQRYVSTAIDDAKINKSVNSTVGYGFASVIVI